jgi:hypothetical protein
VSFNFCPLEPDGRLPCCAFKSTREIQNFLAAVFSAKADDDTLPLLGNDHPGLGIGGGGYRWSPRTIET